VKVRASESDKVTPCSRILPEKLTVAELVNKSYPLTKTNDKLDQYRLHRLTKEVLKFVFIAPH
jgi:hypothetical protein